MKYLYTIMVWVIVVFNAIGVFATSGGSAPTAPAVVNTPCLKGSPCTSVDNASKCTADQKLIIVSDAELKRYNNQKYWCEQCDPEICNCGVKLNTDVPFIGKCLQYGSETSSADGATTVTAQSAFPFLMGALIRLLLGVILIICFGTLIVAGFMMTTGDEGYTKGKGLILKVVYTIASLGLLGIILYLINPNFFR